MLNFGIFNFFCFCEREQKLFCNRSVAQRYKNWINFHKKMFFFLFFFLLLFTSSFCSVRFFFSTFHFLLCKHVSMIEYWVVVFTENESDMSWIFFLIFLISGERVWCNFGVDFELIVWLYFVVRVLNEENWVCKLGHMSFWTLNES